MQLTPQDIQQRIEGLRAEIAERQKLIDAWQTILDDPLLAVVVAAVERPNLGKSVAETLAGQSEPSEQRFSWRSENPTAAVRNAIRHMRQEFTLNEVIAWLNVQQYQIARQDVSFVLSRLAKKGEITTIRKGAGKSPAVFAPLPANTLTGEEQSQFPEEVTLNS